jgi:hypothetical protein
MVVAGADGKRPRPHAGPGEPAGKVVEQAIDLAVKVQQRP